IRQPISFSRDFRRSSRSFPLIKGLMRCFLQAAPRPEDTVPHSRPSHIRLSKSTSVNVAAATIVKTTPEGKRNSGQGGSPGHHRWARKKLPGGGLLA